MPLCSAGASLAAAAAAAATTSVHVQHVAALLRDPTCMGGYLDPEQAQEARTWLEERYPDVPPEEQLVLAVRSPGGWAGPGWVGQPW